MRHNIAIFASGSGTNAENIINHFKESKTGYISYVLSNKPNAYVLERAKRLGIQSIVIEKEKFKHPLQILHFLKEEKIDFIVLAGFLQLLPPEIADPYRGRIINIHPSLLPKYGGRGMYGNNIHKTVIENNETETGITIHLVDCEYDKGEILFQASCPVYTTDTVEELANRVHRLEYEHYPQIIEQRVEKLEKISL